MYHWNPWILNQQVSKKDAPMSPCLHFGENFDLPIQLDSMGKYLLSPEQNPIYICPDSEFFLKEADEKRDKIWEMIKERTDLDFIIITKKIDRVKDCLPKDWGMGYDNVTLSCLCTNQTQADLSIPIFLNLPLKYRELYLEPLLGPIDLLKYLKDHRILKVTCGGDENEGGSPCDYQWILSLKDQCQATGTDFYFKQTGNRFIMKGKEYRIGRKDQIRQADKANINLQFNQKKNIPFGQQKTLGVEAGFSEFEEMDFSQLMSLQEAASKEVYEDLFYRLGKSKFRSRFQLKEEDFKYIEEKGLDVIESHARDFITKRLGPKEPEHDGKQTPMRGHPIFIGQHATATCCRGCLYKWHHIPEHIPLSQKEIDYIVNVLMEWVKKQLNNRNN